MREVRVLEEAGVSPHHPVQMKLKRSFQGLVTRVQVVPSALPAPIVGCVREPRCWDFAQSTSMDERWRQLMQCTEREILGGCDILGDEARAHMGRGLTPRWVIKKVAPAKSYNRPRMARDRAVVDGSPAHQTTAPAPAARLRGFVCICVEWRSRSELRRTAQRSGRCGHSRVRRT